jgi:hypothetical protein
VALLEPTRRNNRSLALRWTPSPDGDFSAYRIYRNEKGSVSGSDRVAAEIRDPGRTEYIDTDLDRGTDYFYRVRVIDRAGLSAWSNERQVKARDQDDDDSD